MEYYILLLSYVLAMENAARKTKRKMTVAERKRKQRAKAQADVTEEKKQA